ncbi:MAG: hypothetical protein LBC75_07785 [Fibromonadaceae bacterium]|jgi:hypothetical protein|nr:hypothetical protein [Fibromonadaceae bacterium]
MIFAILLFSFAVFAQELPRGDILINGEVPLGFYKAGIRYGNSSGDSLHIKWSHAAEADTFWVHKGKLSLEYITRYGKRTAWYNNPLRYERRMATHHLREYVLNSPLKFDNLESLAKNQNPMFSGKNLLEYFTR